MLQFLVGLSIRFRRIFVLLFLGLMLGGVLAAKNLPIDAVPDISTVQVSVLTDAPGLSALEVERSVTFPLENALNGVPGVVELRSTSRADLSMVTLVFRDGSDPWFVRSLVLERVLQARSDLPAGIPTPQLAPLTTGLGRIYQFVVRSDVHSNKQLRTILDWEIVPRLRGTPGVIEVNTMGGQLKQYQVVIESEQLKAQGMTVRELADELRAANAIVSGGYVDRGAEAYTLRAVGTFGTMEDIANVVLKVGEDGNPVLVKHVAQVHDGAALRQGVVTSAGSEAVTGVILMLLGSNSRDVVYEVKDRLATIQKDLPPGVFIEPIYDRADFVERTLSTVMTNLVEGAGVVMLCLWILLGTIRGALVVVLGIPASMTIALFGMHWQGITGDLMSLGAIDFGFLVDGPIVVLEALVATYVGKQLSLHDRAAAYARTIGQVIRPVAFSVAIIMLVYVPLLGLEGVEGKMFKPMAMTMAFALFGAVVYSVVFLPALLVTFVPPLQKEGAAWLARLTHLYERALPTAVRLRWPLLGSTLAALLVSGYVFGQSGADFVPRIDEGDLVVAMRRAPSINLEEAKRLDLEVQEELKSFPEVLSAVAMTGRPEVALDPVGKESTDLVVHLRPKKEWTTAKDLDGLSVAIKNRLESKVPSTSVSVSQPIEDATNDLISGSRADVRILVQGADLFELKRLSEEIGEAVRPIEGTGDLRVERALGMPELTIKPDRAQLARYGVRMQEVLAAIEAIRVGTPLGWVFEGQKRFEVRLLVPPESSAVEALGDLFVETGSERLVPLAELAKIEEAEGPAAIRRNNRVRGIRVEVNLRGRDLVSWVAEAKAAVDAKVKLPSGYKLLWGGQFENFERASKRLAVVVPISLGVIFIMLMWIFADARYAAAVFAVVPFALTGGLVGLILRDMSFSIPAAVGFIALAGVAVLNGVVLATEVRRFLEEGRSFEDALVHGSVHTMRAVLTTGAVAAFGFMPMALATGAGSEVQRPLATVVVVGIGASTLMTMFLLPCVLKLALRREQEVPPPAPTPG